MIIRNLKLRDDLLRNGRCQMSKDLQILGLNRAGIGRAYVGRETVPETHSWRQQWRLTGV